MVNGCCVFDVYYILSMKSKFLDVGCIDIDFVYYCIFCVDYYDESYSLGMNCCCLICIVEYLVCRFCKIIFKF